MAFWESATQENIFGSSGCNFNFFNNFEITFPTYQVVNENFCQTSSIRKTFYGISWHHKVVTIIKTLWLWLKQYMTYNTVSNSQGWRSLKINVSMYVQGAFWKDFNVPDLSKINL